MKKTLLILLIILVISLVACQEEAPLPTKVATAVPIEEASPEAQEATEAPEPTSVVATAVPTEEPAAGPTTEAVEVGDTTTVIPEEQVAQLAALAPPPKLSNREPGIHTVPCMPGTAPSKANEVEGEDYYCGVFTLPQNWDEPDGRYLDLSFLVASATGENPESDPFLFLAGGPGESAILAETLVNYQKLRADRNIILYDIRGVGLSQRLGFEECLVLALQNGARAEQIEALQVAAVNLLGYAGVDTSSVTPESKPNIPLLNEICWEQFTAQGLDLNQFTTASNARDAVELIKALGYESFNIHGTSYGTRLAMTIMDNMPEYNDAPELRSVVLDSTFPPSVYLVNTRVRSDHDFMLQLLGECQADPACNNAYPNLSERLAALLNKLEEEPLITGGETVTIGDVVAQLTDVGVPRAGYMPKMIAELETGVLDTYLALRDGEVSTSFASELDMSDPVQAFITNALDLLSGESAIEFKLLVDIVLVQEEPLTILQAFIEETYPGEISDQMLAMLGALTIEDIANSSYVAQLPQVEVPEEGEFDPEEQFANFRRTVAGTAPKFLFTSIHCADDIQFERIEDALNSYNDLQFPQLTNLEEARSDIERCENWPIKAAPIEVKDPVNSDVPTIILQGAYDKPTPVYMGRRAARELENNTYILIPQAGHGTWKQADDCVGQIATAFVQNPQATLDLSCLDSLRPQWVLPGDGAS